MTTKTVGNKGPPHAVSNHVGCGDASSTDMYRMWPDDTGCWILGDLFDAGDETGACVCGDGEMYVPRGELSIVIAAPGAIPMLTITSFGVLVARQAVADVLAAELKVQRHPVRIEERGAAIAGLEIVNVLGPRPLGSLIVSARVKHRLEALDQLGVTFEPVT